MQTATLSNGLRVIFEHRDSEVIHCGYVICAGTRHEELDDSGMAHFIEHMSFKGTERRRSYHISNGLERLGGDLNAYTNKQETVYYATVLREDFPRAVDILTDLVFHSVYPQPEIDKEVEVIADEIESYLDSPAELIFDDFEAMLFEGSPLGRDILGRAERLRQYTTADARRFADRHYRPDNAVFYVTGRLDWKRVLRELNRWALAPSPAYSSLAAPSLAAPSLAASSSAAPSLAVSSSAAPSLAASSSAAPSPAAPSPAAPSPAAPSSAAPSLAASSSAAPSLAVSSSAASSSAAPLIKPRFYRGDSAPVLRVIDKGTHQAHVILGAPTFGGHEAAQRRYALALLNNILGGPGMSSRLNMALREHAGLVYSIDSYLTTYTDAGWWCIYFGCDPDDVDRCLRLVHKVLHGFIAKPLTPTQIASAKRQLIGQLTITDANAENFALALGKQYAHYGTLRSSAAVVQGIRAVTAADLQSLAAEIYAEDRLYTLIYK